MTLREFIVYVRDHAMLLDLDVPLTVRLNDQELVIDGVRNVVHRSQPEALLLGHHPQWARRGGVV